jgi:hypothetical protein
MNWEKPMQAIKIALMIVALGLGVCWGLEVLRLLNIIANAPR